MRRLSILGSTGSIGKQTLEVCRKAPADFTVEGLSCGSDTETLYEQIKEFSPKAAAVSDEAKGAELARRLKEEGIHTEIYTGEDASSVVAQLDDCDTVVECVFGLCELPPTTFHLSVTPMNSFGMNSFGMRGKPLVLKHKLKA